MNWNICLLMLAFSCCFTFNAFSQNLKQLEQNDPGLELLVKLRSIINLNAEDNYFIRIYILENAAGSNNCNSEYGEIVSDLILVCAENDEVPATNIYKFGNLMSPKGFKIENDFLEFEYWNCQGLSSSKFRIRREAGLVFLDETVD
jgi:hypothetical protein